VFWSNASNLHVDSFGVKSEELKARLKQLEDIAERKAYQELVKDIAPKEDVTEPFSSYKDQLGFGIIRVYFIYYEFLAYLLSFLRSLYIVHLFSYWKIFFFHR